MTFFSAYRISKIIITLYYIMLPKCEVNEDLREGWEKVIQTACDKDTHTKKEGKKQKWKLMNIAFWCLKQSYIQKGTNTNRVALIFKRDKGLEKNQ